MGCFEIIFGLGTNGHLLIAWPLKPHTCNGICIYVQWWVQFCVILPHPSPPYSPVLNIWGYSRQWNQEQQAGEGCQVCIDRMEGKVK